MNFVQVLANFVMRPGMSTEILVLRYFCRSPIYGKYLSLLKELLLTKSLLGIRSPVFLLVFSSRTHPDLATATTVLSLNETEQHVWKPVPLLHS